MFILHFEKETNNDFVGFGFREPQISLHLVYVQL